MVVVIIVDQHLRDCRLRAERVHSCSEVVEHSRNVPAEVVEERLQVVFIDDDDDQHLLVQLVDVVTCATVAFSST